MNHPGIVARVISVRNAPAPFAIRHLSHARLPLTALLTLVGLLLPGAALAQQADGERLFRQRCSACHTMESGQNRVGPHLSSVVGRTAGSAEGARYSAAMRESGIVWDAQSLDTFLAAPRQVVEGTTMTVGVPNAEQRAAIIAYLEGAGAQ